MINVFIDASLVYFNFLYLIPNYLTKNKFKTYLILLVLSVLIVTPLKVLTFYFKFSGFQEAQDGLIEDL
ncbi:MAG: histidine kinase, partial [Bacteroidota bacterium]